MDSKRHTSIFTVFVITVLWMDDLLLFVCSVKCPELDGLIPTTNPPTSAGESTLTKLSQSTKKVGKGVTCNTVRQHNIVTDNTWYWYTSMHVMFK